MLDFDYVKNVINLNFHCSVDNVFIVLIFGAVMELYRQYHCDLQQIDEASEARRRRKAGPETQSTQDETENEIA